ncbi:MAG: DUF4386 domain-containing protein, partial [Pseudonocardiaceae bacterium]
MTNRARKMIVGQHAGGAPPPAGLGLDANRSIRKASIIAGTGTLLLAALGGFALSFVEGLLTQGDAARTAKDIMDSEGMFRLSIVSLFLTVMLDVIVAWALFRLFSPVSKGVSMLAAWFRILFAGVFMVAISQLVGILHPLGNQENPAVFNTDQSHAQVLLGINTFK